MDKYQIGPALRSSIEYNLQHFDRRGATNELLHPAAVAIVITTTADNGDAGFVLTRRASRLRRHGGQYALPGGRVDANENPRAAALRELEEELDLTISEHDVLGRLDDYSTRSGFRIRPYVMWAGADANITPNPDEVDAVFRIPIMELDFPEIPQLDQIPESDNPVLSAPFPTLGHEVYAPTAAILYQFREVALHGRCTRVAHYEQPLFAWR
ncbi:MAG: CoA pyrophosphatase [Gammaproteobacteria bacterium]|nr:CoA pyrophosphatase [Gammaproteobacteria bacterium]MDH3464537.1 CoA pyrophosphatase [Gammaproteobacteria bacterium]